MGAGFQEEPIFLEVAVFDEQVERYCVIEDRLSRDEEAAVDEAESCEIGFVESRSRRIGSRISAGRGGILGLTGVDRVDEEQKEERERRGSRGETTKISELLDMLSANLSLCRGCTKAHHDLLGELRVLLERSLARKVEGSGEVELSSLIDR